MTMIEEALTQTTDTKACEIGPGVTGPLRAIERLVRRRIPNLKER